MKNNENQVERNSTQKDDGKDYKNRNSKKSHRWDSNDRNYKKL